MNSTESLARIGALAFTGRFQPFHLDHLAMVRYALEQADRVIIGITNPDPAARISHPASAHRHLAAANPFSYAQRQNLIVAALQADGIATARVSIVPFPLEDPSHWQNLMPRGTPQLVRVFSDWEREKLRRFESAGFPTIVLHGDLSNRICASDVRRMIEHGEPWQSWVPPGARELLSEWLAAPINRLEPLAGPARHG